MIKRVLTNPELNITLSNVIADLVTDFQYGAAGTATTTPAATDEELGGEILRKARQEYLELSSYAIFSLYISSTEVNGNAINELGWFKAASGGSARQRDVITTINKTADIEVWADTTVNVSVTQS